MARRITAIARRAAATRSFDSKRRNGATKGACVIDATPGIAQNLRPDDWSRHRFGLPAARWQALAGRVFWVTGAGTGYGQAIAVALAAAGSTVYVSGRRNDRLAATAAAAAHLSASGRVAPLPLDITDAAAVNEAARRIGETTGAIHGLVNSAALPAPPAGLWPLQDCTPEQWQQLFATNVTGPWLVSRAALAYSGAPARIVLLTSEAGWAATPGFGPYNVSKAALNSLGASLAAESAKRQTERDVQINVLIAGEARTEMNQGSDVSPYTIVPMTLALLSHPPGGPNGKFFHRDGRHFSFAYAAAYERALL